MAWTADIYPHIPPYEPNDFLLFPAPPHPTTILQQLPATMTPPDSAPSIRPGGHVKEDLVALMMVQNAQMHQVIVSRMATSARRLCQPPGDLVLIPEDEPEPEVHHHYYEPAPHLSGRRWVAPRATVLYKSGSALPRSDRPAVARPPPSPAASGTLGVGAAPAAENIGAAEGEEEQKSE